MAAIPGQPAPKPSGIIDPVPGQEQQDSIGSFLSDFQGVEVASGAPEPTPGPAPTPAPQPQEDAIGDFLNQSAQIPGAPEGVTGGQLEEEPGFLEANIAQFGDTGTRTQAGLAANDNEKLAFLQKKFGPNNAFLNKKDDKIYFRKAGTDKFKKLDPAAFELLNDVIPDWSREIIQEMALLPAEIGGAALGSAIAPGAGTAAGAVGGRVIATPIANAIADEVARFAGIPQDEGRDIMTENLTGAAVEGVLPVVGKFTVKPAAKALSKQFPGTRAYQEALDAGERELTALNKQSMEVAKSVAALEEVGRSAKLDGSLVGVPGSEVNLMGHQLNPDAPILSKVAHQAADNPKFINAQTQLAEDWGASLDNTLREIGRRNVKGPFRPEKLAESVTNAVADTVAAEGKAIGKYKAKALAKLGNAKQPLPPEMSKQVGSMLQEFGFTAKNVGKGAQQRTVWEAPKDVRALVGKGGLTSTGEVRAVVNNLSELSKGMSEGGLRISDLDRLRNSVGATSDRLSLTKAGSDLAGLSGQLRKEYRNAISKGLDDDFERAAFNTTMDEFSQLKTNVGVLKRSLDKDASSKAIVQTFFTGKENLKKIEAIKKIHPDSFENLKREFVNTMINDFASRNPGTGWKSTQFLDAVNKKYGKEFLSKVLGPGGKPGEVGLKEVKHLLNVTERIDKTFIKTKPRDMTDAQKQGMMDIFMGLVANVHFKLVNGVSSVLKSRLEKNHPFFEIMTREGMDKYVANYPGKIDRKGTLRKANDILADIKLWRTAGDVEREVRGRAVKATLRNEGQKATND